VSSQGGTPISLVCIDQSRHFRELQNRTVVIEDAEILRTSSDACSALRATRTEATVRGEGYRKEREREREEREKRERREREKRERDRERRDEYLKPQLHLRLLLLLLRLLVLFANRREMLQWPKCLLPRAPQNWESASIKAGFRRTAELDSSDRRCRYEYQNGSEKRVIVNLFRCVQREREREERERERKRERERERRESK
jgi:hypothetical protein